MTLRTLLKILSILAMMTASIGALSDPVKFSEIVTLKTQSTLQDSYSYGSTPNQTVIHLASTDSSDVLVIVHGGCWSNAYDRNHTLPMAEALSTMGYDVWVPEYRRVGDAGGGWPGSLEDIIAAVEFVTDKTGQEPILVGHALG